MTPFFQTLSNIPFSKFGGGGGVVYNGPLPSVDLQHIIIKFLNQSYKCQQMKYNAILHTSNLEPIQSLVQVPIRKTNFGTVLMKVPDTRQNEVLGNAWYKFYTV